MFEPMTEFVTVSVPAELYPAIVKLMADHLADIGALTHPGAQTWADVAAGAGQDEALLATHWWGQLRTQEKDLLQHFASLDVDEIEASELAQGLGMTPSELAGVLGPFQRRMVKEDFPVALTSRTASVSQRRVKVLRLAEGLADIVRSFTQLEGATPKEIPTKEEIQRHGEIRKAKLAERKAQSQTAPPRALPTKEERERNRENKERLLAERKR